MITNNMSDKDSIETRRKKFLESDREFAGSRQAPASIKNDEKHATSRPKEK